METLLEFIISATVAFVVVFFGKTIARLIKSRMAARAHDISGLRWISKGQFDKAIADYTKAIELNPNFVAAYNIRGIVWSKKAEFDKAFADYNKAIELKPDLAEAYYNRAEAKFDNGDREGALKDVRKAIGLFRKQGNKPSLEKAQELEARINPPTP